MRNLDVYDLLSKTALWTWLTFVLPDQLFRRTPDGTLKVGELHRWYPSNPNDWQEGQHHLVRMPVLLLNPLAAASITFCAFRRQSCRQSGSSSRADRTCSTRPSSKWHGFFTLMMPPGCSSAKQEEKQAGPLVDWQRSECSERNMGPKRPLPIAFAGLAKSSTASFPRINPVENIVRGREIQQLGLPGRECVLHSQEVPVVGMHSAFGLEME